MQCDLQTRPIDEWPGPLRRSHERKRAPFRVGYGKLINDLQREVDHLRATSCVLLMALDQSDIRLDGRPRAGATPRHPGVILVLQTPSGQMRWPCDTYNDWADNLRAISLSLAALRAVDRYGVTKRGEQYTGWMKLEAPNGDHWTKEQAREFLRSIIGNTFDAVPILAAIRECERRTHPDAGGDVDKFKKVQQARALLIQQP